MSLPGYLNPLTLSVWFLRIFLICFWIEGVSHQKWSKALSKIVVCSLDRARFLLDAQECALADPEFSLLEVTFPSKSGPGLCYNFGPNFDREEGQGLALLKQDLMMLQMVRESVSLF